MKSGYIKNIELNGETVFSITDSGEAAIKYFYHSIPYSVREKFLKSIEVINRQAKSESEIIVKCIPVNESEYMVECEINEAGESLLKLSLNAGNREMAESAAQKFKDNHGEIYNMIIRAMS